MVGLLPLVPPMTELSPQTVTQWLLKWRGGDESALNDLSGLVYEDLHRLAQKYFRREKPDHTLPATRLGHEGFLPLPEMQHIHLEKRAHVNSVVPAGKGHGAVGP